MYTLDAIEEQHLHEAFEVLQTLRNALYEGGLVYASGLLFDDDEPVLTHVLDAEVNLAEILTKVQAEKTREGL